MVRLGVNIDHIATLREVRHGIEPEPVFAALICQAAGADGIVVHLREDRRHIKERDLFILREIIKTKLNLEMSVTEEIVKIACQVKPDQATLVPEKRQELTTEGGLDVCGNLKRIIQVRERLERNGIGSSLFIDPDKRQIDAAKKSGVKMIELHTGRYANAKGQKQQEAHLKEIKAATGYAAAKGLEVFAGHGLNYYNVTSVARIDGIEELNIGYSIVCRAALVGLDRAVREMKELIEHKR
ncbi:MAG: pyridoxine 5'-phosphate synthase [Candidatus Omnitrophica bacterium]|nr:pyridoxine 5'-phosphate synthase [Candidatus Omnitrophota bacterium]